MHGQFKMRKHGLVSSWTLVSCRGSRWWRGAEAAVLVPVQEWRRLQAFACPSLKALLLSELGRVEMIVPARGQAKRRNVAPMS